MKNLFLISFVLLSIGFARAEKCPKNIVASCTTVSEGNVGCMDLVQSTTPVDQFKAGCKNEGGKFSTSPCTKDQLAGSCTVALGQMDGMVLRFYAPLTADMVNMICTGMSGKSCK